MRVVVDTNILVSAFLNPATAPRHILRLCLKREITPLIGSALFSEYRDVLDREGLLENSPLNVAERNEFFDALMSVSEWVNIHYLWRPNLRDEADNHLIELAVAGDASTIISANIRDLKFGELLFPSLRIMTAGDFIQHRSNQWQR